MINESLIVVEAKEVDETVEIKSLRELREKVNNLEKRLIDIDILEKGVIKKVKGFDFFTMILQVFHIILCFMKKNKVEKDIVKITIEKEVIKEKKIPDDLLCGCECSIHYGEKYKEIKKLMDNHNYDFYAWEKRCPVNWVKKVDEEKLEEKLKERDELRRQVPHAMLVDIKNHCID